MLKNLKLDLISLCTRCVTILLVFGLPGAVESFLTLPKVTKYLAQVKVYVDDAGFRQWRTETRMKSSKDLDNAIRSVFDDVNKLYKSLEEDDIFIQFEVKDVVYPKYYDTIFTGKNDYTMSSGLALSDFYRWVKQTYRPYDFDFAIMFTGNDIYAGGNYGTGGVAGKGTVCDEKGVGIVEIFGKIEKSDKPSEAARLTAHEIGHILGSDHDEAYSACANEKNYLMYSTVKRVPTDDNPYQFTKCSVKAIAEHIDTLNKKGKNCMMPNDVGISAADKACQEREKGTNWYLSRGSYSEGYGDKLCAKLQCTSLDSTTKKLKFTKGVAPDGLACAKDKQCMSGKCIPAKTDDPYMTDSCPFGDQNLQAIGYSYNCERKKCSSWKHWCCAFCSRQINQG